MYFGSHAMAIGRSKRYWNMRIEEYAMGPLNPHDISRSGTDKRVA